MSQYSITLSSAEDKALSYATFSQDEWIQHSVHERCRVAIEEIVAITVQLCLANNVQIPSSKDEIVELAFSQEWVKTASERQEESKAARAAEQAAAEAAAQQGA